MERAHVVVVGAGFCGTLVASHLLRAAKGPLRVTLIERRVEMSRGVAYSTNTLVHLLNVRAAQMSAFPDEPNSLVSWLEKKRDHWKNVTGSELSPDSFIPRKIYGTYLQDMLELSAAGSHGQLEKVRDEAVTIVKKDGRYHIGLRGGRRLEADKAVLAVGNFPPSNPFPHSVSSDLPSSSYAADPWSANATADLTQDRPVLLVGTGLTTVDLVLSLDEQGFRGPVYAVSRHGLLPQSHRASAKIEDFILGALDGPPTARRLSRAVRERIGKSPEEWRGVIDSLRPHNQSLWKALSLPEKKRFVRHLKAYWDVHRHRIAPQIAAKLEELRKKDWLRVMAGRLTDCHEVREGVDVVFTPRHSDRGQVLRVQRIVNCSGPSYRHPRRGSALLAQLEDAGLMRPHPLMGVDTDDQGALIDARGIPSRDLFTLGSVRTGSLWETIAVPELKGQAAQVARQVLAELEAGSEARRAPERPRI